jgi:chitinase
VCYYGSWAKYRKQAGRFTPEKIDANLCTHVIFTFAKLRGNRLVAGDWQDESTAFRKGM